MTTVMARRFGWVYIVLVLNWYTKKIVAYSMRMLGTATPWLEALNMAVNR